ncbi:CHASE2 domain-containing protein [Aulosira sp. FACHB-615]|uniref:CHASE2 domain-containing protein n=1 Tax=Aulosira sp. FACHB-615 TaxID=2692777 RepID=UPI0016828E30|nr:CHASE2 domain-containing protein [Aulosira sp. FACHB-615]MBD2492321.1 CHASE2 domain-containing protein [Aulosira sp. FACHB-615]
MGSGIHKKVIVPNFDLEQKGRTTENYSGRDKGFSRNTNKSGQQVNLQDSDSNSFINIHGNVYGDINANPSSKTGEGDSIPEPVHPEPKVFGLNQLLLLIKDNEDWIRWLSCGVVFTSSLLITISVITVRSVGILQQFELGAFDLLMRLRLNEAQDQRLLIVGINDDDIEKYKEYPLSDQKMLELLQKLENPEYKPLVIGLDIFRDVPQADKKNYEKLLQYLQQMQNIIGICKLGNTGAEGVTPPKGISLEYRIGFSNVDDDDDEIIRRHPIWFSTEPTYPCQTIQSLSFLLADRFLKTAGYEFNLTQKPEEYIQYGSTIIKHLRSELPVGSYQKLSEPIRGTQILLNYRAVDPVSQKVSLTDVLENKIKPEWVKDKIVLIGYTAEQVGDLFLTPYSDRESPKKRMPGVEVQAHMVSQILSAVLDKRPLLEFCPQWIENLCIWIWSLIGGGIAWFWRKKRYKKFAELGTATFILCLLSYALLHYGIWIPLVPSLLALVAASAVLLNLRRIPNIINSSQQIK